MVDPLFVDVRINDYRLQSNSPAKDVGVNIGLSKDSVGTPVPQGTGVDIGAFEYKEDKTPLKAPTGLYISIKI